MTEIERLMEDPEFRAFVEEARKTMKGPQDALPHLVRVALEVVDVWDASGADTTVVAPFVSKLESVCMTIEKSGWLEHPTAIPGCYCRDCAYRCASGDECCEHSDVGNYFSGVLPTGFGCVFGKRLEARDGSD